MARKKPVIFISHIHEDAVIASGLKATLTPRSLGCSSVGLDRGTRKLCRRCCSSMNA